MFPFAIVDLQEYIIKIFSSDQIGDDHKQVKSGETGNTSEQLDSILKTSTAEHHGRFTEI